MYDSWGDGWNGNTLSVGGSSVTLASGAEGTATVCVDMSVCNTIEVGGGTYGSEVSWEIGDLTGTVGTYEIGDCAPADVEGCMDANATNYNADATVMATNEWGDILCIYESCDSAPYEGCLWADAYATYNEFFGPADCSNYGGTACV